MPAYKWYGAQETTEIVYKCGYCGADAAPSRMFVTENTPSSNLGRIYICPHCNQPTFFSLDQQQTPKPRIGHEIQGISKEDVARLYQEARDCTSVGAYTAAVMVCRKILMNLAVDQQAKEGKAFSYYVDYLANNGYVPPQGKNWVDAIRKRGNEANHEIALKYEKDAKLMLDFTAALLRFNYELPSLLESDRQTNISQTTSQDSA